MSRKVGPRAERVKTLIYLGGGGGITPCILFCLTVSVVLISAFHIMHLVFWFYTYIILYQAICSSNDYTILRSYKLYWIQTLPRKMAEICAKTQNEPQVQHEHHKNHQYN